jgi:hypothetical protein
MLRTLAGLLYGGLLGGLAVIAAGAGHGTYIPMGVSSAPFGLFGFPAAAVGAPILWGTVGALLHLPRTNRGKRITISVLAIHYGTALALAISRSFGDWGYVRLFAWAGAYAVGQLVIWRSVLRTAG